MALAPEGMEGRNVKMGKAKTVRFLLLFSTVLLKLDSVLLFFAFFGAVWMDIPCCDPKTLTTLLFSQRCRGAENDAFLQHRIVHRHSVKYSREPRAASRESGTGNGERERGTGNRERGTGNREPGTGNRGPDGKKLGDAGTQPTFSRRRTRRRSSTMKPGNRIQARGMPQEAAGRLENRKQDAYKKTGTRP